MAFVSGVCSAFLLCRLRRVHRARKSRLLIRQLQHLAAGNLLNTFWGVLYMALNLSAMEFEGLQHMSPNAGLAICVVTNYLQDMGSWTSLLVECHMAVAFAASIYGASWVLEAASAVLVYVWVVGPLAAVVEMGLTGQAWDKKAHEDGVACLVYRDDYFFSIFILLGVIVCFSCYIASIVSISGAGQAVQRSVWRRAQLYPLVALITYMPFVFNNFFPINTEPAADWMLLVVNSLFLSNGLLNFSVYAFQSKYLKPNMSKPPQRVGANGESPRYSYHVNFRGDPSIVEPRTTLVSNAMASDYQRDVVVGAQDSTMDSGLLVDMIDYCEGALDVVPETVA